jgi:hypothetical protein
LNADSTIRISNIRPVAHQTARHNELAVSIYGWHCVVGRQLDQPITLGIEQSFTADHECARPLADKSREGRLDLAGTTCIQDHHACAEDPCCSL